MYSTRYKLIGLCAEFIQTTNRAVQVDALLLHRNQFVQLKLNAVLSQRDREGNRVGNGGKSVGRKWEENKDGKKERKKREKKKENSMMKEEINIKRNKQVKKQ